MKCGEVICDEKVKQIKRFDEQFAFCFGIIFAEGFI